ncbi:MAG TPA: hypothetical protein DD412_04420 [Holosporales bacterium]|nr:hypothetical protein [Holosporales bacterium]
MVIKNKNKKTINVLSIGLLIMTSLLLTGHDVKATTQNYNMKFIPKNGLNVDWPVLLDREYFTYRGRSARSMTLRAIMHFDCHRLTELYSQDPLSALYDLELFILVQFALRGIDIQTMKQKDREDLALSEVAKRLRQFGRIKETTNLFKNPRGVPTIAGLCQILKEDKEDLLRQKYHIRHQWDRYKVGQSE